MAGARAMAEVRANVARIFFIIFSSWGQSVDRKETKTGRHGVTAEMNKS